MRVDVLGPVRLSTDAGEPVPVPERKVRLLLALLVSREGEAVPADTLVEQVWGDGRAAHPTRVLRAKLSQLRSALDLAAEGGRGLLVHTPAGYRLDLPTGAVDAERFRDRVERARAAGSARERADLLGGALALWRGGAYADVADELGLAPVLAALEDARLGALEERAEALAESGEPEAAVELASAPAKEHPTRERLTGALMSALYRTGRQRDALMLFESLRERLAEELGADPGPQLRALHERILRQDPELAAAPGAGERPAPGSEQSARGRLPSEISPIIGRAEEAFEVGCYLDRGRLLTLTGIGGVGKTRLAVHVAHARREHFPRGVWFVDLTALSPSPGFAAGAEPWEVAYRVTDLVAAAIGLPVRTVPDDCLHRLGDALGERPSLLVLDNCEHVVEEAAAFVGGLLESVAGVRVLATGREPLNLPDEQRYDLRPLTVTAEGGPGPAVQFFTERARAVDPGFVLDSETEPVVERICRALDGLPLAMELAANRVRALSVHELSDRLAHRLNLLSRPGGRVPRRQQTLRAMIDWSWRLLDGAEHRVLRRLAVFRGDCSLAAAEAVCADPDGAGDEGVPASSVLDVLTGLLDRSLVTSEPVGRERRFGLLESIRIYAAEKLAEAGELEEAERRHLNHYTDLVRRADAGLRGPDQRAWLCRMDTEHVNLPQALDTALSHGEGAHAVELTLGTFWHRWITGRMAHVGEDLAAAVALPGPRDDRFARAEALSVALEVHEHPERAEAQVDRALSLFGARTRVERAEVQWFAGLNLFTAGLEGAGERHLSEAIGTLAEHGRDWSAAVAVCYRDWMRLSVHGTLPEGLPDGRGAGEVLEGLGDDWAVAQSLSVDHLEAEVLGRYGRARAVSERALALCEDLGLPTEVCWWRVSLAVCMLRDGEETGAADLLQRAREQAHGLVDTYCLGYADLAEAMAARRDGDLVRARRCLDRWTGVAATSGAGPLTGLEEGFLALAEGEPERAATALRGLLPTVPATDAAPVLARALELRAGTEALGGDPVRAAEALGAAAGVRAGTAPNVLERADLGRVRALVADQLGEGPFAEALERGAGTTPSDVLERPLRG
ncbi:winged helix-turn-helix domain-containing protein [Nocardiopsis sp. HNM0947]|uniref:Winged helix-turn-helix domain-containing protein n=1 Tax=Nocardiopsis coralli TaxID=2772213 RepID=A0ABR9P9S9_9ACTN|nr:BTAD domain-containing putative transcriptional regulator [Nocardiopsis coralli]MBE3000587.1 winged helix-turn-helix domain-containing protein [Nocardiopsis coralli]